MMHIASCRIQMNATESSDVFKHEVCRLHGLPYAFVSDRNTSFTSHCMELADEHACMRIKRSMSTAYHPQSDGQTGCERKC